MASGTSAGRTRSAAIRKTDPDIGFGEFGRNTATKPLADGVGLNPDPPGVAELGEHDRMLRRLAEAQNARSRLLQILVAGQLRKDGRLEPADDPLREHRLGEKPGEETHERKHEDRQDRRHGRSGGEGLRNERRQGLQPAAHEIVTPC